MKNITKKCLLFSTALSMSLHCFPTGAVASSEELKKPIASTSNPQNSVLTLAPLELTSENVTGLNSKESRNSESIANPFLRKIINTLKQTPEGNKDAQKLLNLLNGQTSEGPIVDYPEDGLSSLLSLYDNISENAPGTARKKLDNIKNLLGEKLGWEIDNSRDEARLAGLLFYFENIEELGRFLNNVQANRNFLFVKEDPYGLASEVEVVLSLAEMRYTDFKLIQALQSLFESGMDGIDHAAIIRGAGKGDLRTAQQILSFKNAFTQNRSLLFTSIMMPGHHATIIAGLAAGRLHAEEQIANFAINIQKSKDTLFKPDMYGWEQAGIIADLARAGYTDADVISAIAALFTERMGGSERYDIITALGKGGYQDKTKIHLINSFFTQEMDKDRVLKLVTALSKGGIHTESQIRNFISNIQVNKDFLFIGIHFSEDRTWIAELIAQLGPIESKKFKTVASKITEDMSPEDRLMIIREAVPS